MVGLCILKIFINVAPESGELKPVDWLDPNSFDLLNYRPTLAAVRNPDENRETSEWI